MKKIAAVGLLVNQNFFKPKLFLANCKALNRWDFVVEFSYHQNTGRRDNILVLFFVNNRS